MNIYADTVRHVSTLMFISFFFSKGELYAGLSVQKRGTWQIRTAVNGFADR